MSSDPNKKSARTFQCRDVLWETFEQMARELECSVDYLINESMKQYARQRSYAPRTPYPGTSHTPGPQAATTVPPPLGASSPGMASQQPPAQPGFGGTIAFGPGQQPTYSGPPPMPPSSGGSGPRSVPPMPGQRRPTPPPPPSRPANIPSAPGSSSSRAPAPPPSMARQSAMPPMPGANPLQAPGQVAGPHQGVPGHMGGPPGHMASPPGHMAPPGQFGPPPVPLPSQRPAHYGAQGPASPGGLQQASMPQGMAPQGVPQGMQPMQHPGMLHGQQQPAHAGTIHGVSPAGMANQPGHHQAPAPMPGHAPQGFAPPGQHVGSPMQSPMGAPGMGPTLQQPAAPLGQPQNQAQPRAGGPALAAFYAGQRYAVSKERFIIGRGKQSSDLTIKDPNVSRQHAMVEFLNGQYYIVDMGSTNGIEYNGQRIARKVIAEGDLFRICDHEVRFSYR